MTQATFNVKTADSIIERQGYVSAIIHKKELIKIYVYQDKRHWFLCIGDDVKTDITFHSRRGKLIEDFKYKLKNDENIISRNK